MKHDFKVGDKIKTRRYPANAGGNFYRGDGWTIAITTHEMGTEHVVYRMDEDGDIITAHGARLPWQACELAKAEKKHDLKVGDRIRTRRYPVSSAGYYKESGWTIAITTSEMCEEYVIGWVNADGDIITACSKRLPWQACELAESCQPVEEPSSMEAEMLDALKMARAVMQSAGCYVGVFNKIERVINRAEERQS